MPKNSLLVQSSFALSPAQILCSLLISCGPAAPPADPLRTPVIALATLDGRTIAAGTKTQLHDAAHNAGARTEPMLSEEAFTLRVVVVVDVDELIVDSNRGRERVRISGLVGSDPRWPEEMNEWTQSVALPAFTDWITEPGTRLVELPTQECDEAWKGQLPWMDPNGLRVCSLERRSPVGNLAVHEHAIERGWAVGSTPWSDALALSPGLLLGETMGTGGVFELKSSRALASQHEQQCERHASRSPEELQAMGEAELARLAELLDWTPAEPVLISAETPETALPIFEAIIEEFNADAERWGQEELARLSERYESLGFSAPESLSLTLYDPAESATEKAGDLDGFSPAGPTVYLIERGDLDPRSFEHILTHELIHQYQEETYDRNGLFPPLGPFSTLIEAHAEWHSTRITRDRHPGLEGFHGVNYFRRTLLLTRLCEELEVHADEVMKHFFDDSWDAYLWRDVYEGEISLQEYLFHGHSRSRYAGLDFQLGEDWPEEAEIVISNTTDELVRAQFHGVWLLDISETYGPYSTVTTPPFNAILPPKGELRVLLGAGPVELDDSVLLASGLFSLTPSAVE